MTDKPPVIGKDEIADIVGSAKEWWELPSKTAQAQLAADIKWFNQWLEAKEAMKPKVSNDGKRYNVPLRLEEKCRQE